MTAGSRLKAYLKPFLRWQLLVSCAIPFMICDVTPILLVVFGGMWKNAAMVSVGTTWLIFLRTPLGMESLIVLPVGLWIHKMMFKRDKITRYRLLRMLAQGRYDAAKIVNKVFGRNWNPFRRRKHYGCR